MTALLRRHQYRRHLRPLHKRWPLFVLFSITTCKMPIKYEFNEANQNFQYPPIPQSDKDDTILGNKDPWPPFKIKIVKGKKAQLTILAYH